MSYPVNVQNLNFIDSIKSGFKKAEPTLKTVGKVAVKAGQACLAVGCEDLLAAALLQNLSQQPLYTPTVMYLI